MFRWDLVLQFWGTILLGVIGLTYLFLLIFSAIGVFRGKVKIFMYILHGIVFLTMAVIVTIAVGTT